MNVHILPEDKFTQYARQLFEKYYPQENLYIVNTSDINNLKYLSLTDDFLFLDLMNENSLPIIEEKANHKIENIFVHYLNKPHGDVALKLKHKYNSKLYWIPFGVDLYPILKDKKKYILNDYPIKPCKERFTCKLIRQRIKDCIKKIIGIDYTYFYRFVEHCDYFCFWDIYDYELLVNNFHTKCKFKFFAYNEEVLIPIIENAQKTNTIIINNSASPSGNHLSVMRKLLHIDNEKQFDIILPLSYGDDCVVKQVTEYANKYYGNKTTILKDFIPLEQYNEILSKTSVAIFGNRRQEAAGNIFMHMRLGNKVFLRKENNIYRLVKEWGGYVYCFEKELNTIEDLLTPLTQEQIQKNRQVVEQKFSIQSEKNYMQELFAD